MASFKDLASGITTARERRGLTQRDVAKAAGLTQADISRFESGDRQMGVSASKKMTKALKGADPDALRFLNVCAVVKRAIEDTDPETVMAACKSAVEMTDAEEMTEHGEQVLEELLDTSLKFMEGLAGGGSDDGEAYGVGGSDGRDTRGRYVGVEKARADWRESRNAYDPIWGAAPNEATSLTDDDEDYDEPGMDGRDANGHRVVALEDLEDDGNEQYDEEAE